MYILFVRKKQLLINPTRENNTASLHRLHHINIGITWKVSKVGVFSFAGYRPALAVHIRACTLTTFNDFSANNNNYTSSPRRTTFTTNFVIIWLQRHVPPNSVHQVSNARTKIMYTEQILQPVNMIIEIKSTLYVLSKTSPSITTVLEKQVL